MDLTQRMHRMKAREGGGAPKSEAEEIAELMTLGINHPARRRFRDQEERRQHEGKERAWNGSIMRSRPPNLRGLRIATKEPWALDEAFYQKKTGNFEHEYNALEKYDDRSVLSASKGYTAQVTASGLDGAQPAWDSSPLRPVPHVLKVSKHSFESRTCHRSAASEPVFETLCGQGIKPQTREPWAVDMAINRDSSLEGFSTFSAKLENDSVAGNFEHYQ